MLECRGEEEKEEKEGKGERGEGKKYRPAHYRENLRLPPRTPLRRSTLSALRQTQLSAGFSQLEAFTFFKEPQVADSGSTHQWLMKVSGLFH